MPYVCKQVKKGVFELYVILESCNACMCDLTVFAMPGRDDKNKKRFIMTVYAIIPPHLPLPHAKTIFPFTLFILHLSFIHAPFQSVCNFVCFLLFCLQLLIVFYTWFFLFCSSIYCFLPGDIYLLFLKLGLRCCNAPYTTQFWKLY